MPSTTLTTRDGLDFDVAVRHDGSVYADFELVHEHSKSQHVYAFRGHWKIIDISGFKRNPSEWNSIDLQLSKKDSDAGFVRIWGRRKDWPQLPSVRTAICNAILEYMETDQYASALEQAKQDEYRRQIELAKREITSAYRTIELREAHIKELEALLT
jgi:hypothetical protein